MDLRVLRYFVKTVETGSISAAALECHVAQPSITLAIAKLEEEFSCRLLDRHRKGCSPTSDGLKMYSMAKDLLAHAQALTNEFSSIQTKALIKLKVDQNIRISVLENFIQDLQGYSPSVTLSLISPNSKQANNFDMYLTTKNNIEAMDWFIPLMNEQYCLLIPKVNHLAFKTDLSLFDLQDQPLITRIYCENKALFEKTCMDSGLVFNEVAEVETEEWAHALVRSGLGICFAPLPIGFMASEFEIKNLSEFLPKAIPERVVGLCIKPGSQDKIKELLPYLLKEGALS